ncbi:MAG: transaldolase / glucose-6-phosphate isomerase [Pyrinomonadaceae bacterium]|jgi:glucose-6-phosphate isomerase|nr:transaldolase / glucose-6-phosphate isomerase [Pyrinomonadaceae bacterium]
MNDAGNETGLEFGGNEATQQTLALPLELRDAMRDALADAEEVDLIDRVWNKDASLWKNEPPQQKIINNALGWLTVPRQMLAGAEELKTFADTLRVSQQFRHVLVCGMGGSSLCPEVLRQTFGRQEDFPELLVLDSTDPDTINEFAKQIDVQHCLFIVASKSGTTTEPIVFHKFWYNRLVETGANAGDSFIAVTDPGTQMVKAAQADHFRKIFLNQPDIGGRYSALSYFGMAPAAIMGLDVAELLKRAVAASELCGADAPIDENPGAVLGATMAECALAGRDKLTIVTDEKLGSLGLWIEQLIAESTGKEGKGIIPIAGEPLAAPSSYGDDRLFVSISVRGGAENPKLKALEAAGHPVVHRVLNDIYDLGAEFFIWEMATAFAGWRLGINPFDQPNVQESKDATKALLEKYKSDGKLPEQKVSVTDGQLTVYAGGEVGASSGGSVQEALRAHCAQIKPGDYVALLAYLEETPEHSESLQEIRLSVREATQAATTMGYGPRFLHSTGQLHKGGPDSGVFIQITAPDKVDFPIPGEPYTFSVLKDAQALGDFQSLIAHGRRAIRVDLGSDVSAGFESLQRILMDALK